MFPQQSLFQQFPSPFAQQVATPHSPASPTVTFGQPLEYHCFDTATCMEVDDAGFRDTKPFVAPPSPTSTMDFLHQPIVPVASLSATPFDIMRNEPQLLQLIDLASPNPASLIDGLLQQLAIVNPGLVQFVMQNKQSFVALFKATALARAPPRAPMRAARAPARPAQVPVPAPTLAPTTPAPLQPATAAPSMENRRAALVAHFQSCRDAKCATCHKVREIMRRQQVAAPES